MGLAGGSLLTPCELLSWVPLCGWTQIRHPNSHGASMAPMKIWAPFFFISEKHVIKKKTGNFAELEVFVVAAVFCFLFCFVFFDLCDHFSFILKRV